MAMLKRLLGMLDSDKGGLVVSAILGFGAASLFRKACRDGACIRFVAPDPDMIQGHTWRYNGKCYQYKLEDAPCPVTGKPIAPAPRHITTAK